jgi:hypothetical protein
MLTCGNHPRTKRVALTDCPLVLCAEVINP